MIVKPKEIKFVGTTDGQTIGLTSGCFDLLHYYHLLYFLRCEALCDVLIVGVDSDDLVMQNKGKAPAVPEHQRLAMVEALGCVDVAFMMRNINDLSLAGESADYLFKNGATIYGEDIIGAETAKLVLVPDVAEITSTTQLKQKIRYDYTTHYDEYLIEFDGTVPNKILCNELPPGSQIQLSACGDKPLRWSDITALNEKVAGTVIKDEEDFWSWSGCKIRIPKEFP